MLKLTFSSDSDLKVSDILNSIDGYLRQSKIFETKSDDLKFKYPTISKSGLHWTSTSSSSNVPTIFEI